MRALVVSIWCVSPCSLSSPAQNAEVPRITGFKVNVFVPKPSYAQMVEDFNALCEAERIAAQMVDQSNQGSAAVRLSLSLLFLVVSLPLTLALSLPFSPSLCTTPPLFFFVSLPVLSLSPPLALSPPISFSLSLALSPPLSHEVLSRDPRSQVSR